MFYFYLLLFGGAVGVAGGLLGLGGGIALVPGLMLLFGFTQQEAQGTSLAVMIPPIGIFAALVYYQHNYIRLPVVGWVAAGFTTYGFWPRAHLVTGGTPRLTVDRTTIDFGDVHFYRYVDAVFTLSNAGDGVLAIDGWTKVTVAKGC